MSEISRPSTQVEVEVEPSNSRNHGIKPMLSALPPELILIIACFLPEISAASLALCSKSLLSSLFKEHCVPLQRKYERMDREAFWRQMSNDLPDSIFCEHCNFLHPGDKSFVTSAVFPTTCWHKDRRGEIAKFIHQDFRFTTFQMMMKRHRLGLGNECDLYHQLGFKTTDMSGALPIQSFSEPKIVNDSLLLRTQHLVYFPSRDFSTGRTEQQPDITICRHLKFNPQRSDFEAHKYHNPGNPYIRFSLEDVVKLWLHPFQNHRAAPSLVMTPCQHCTTEYRVDVQQWGKESGVIIITRWIDLGSGESILDPKWWSRLPNTYFSQPKFAALSRDCGRDHWPPRVDFIFQRGAICQAFEQENWDNFDPTLDSEQIFELAAKYTEIDGSKVVYIKPNYSIVELNHYR